MTLHINAPRPIREKPWQDAMRLTDAKGRELTNCCNRFVSKRWLDGRVTFFEWYDPHWEFRCKPRYGCNRTPSFKRTAHLRAHYHDGRG